MSREILFAIDVSLSQSHCLHIKALLVLLFADVADMNVEKEHVKKHKENQKKTKKKTKTDEDVCNFWFHPN